MRIEEQVALAGLTTLGVGGPARYLAEARSIDEVRQALEFAGSRQSPLFVLGGGSNLVVADRGWPGLVLKIALGGMEERREDGRALFAVGAGVNWDDLVARSVAADCAGIECLSGIPGTVGGTPVQNVGAYGQEVSETITSVLALDLRDGQLREFCNEACGFAYRTSMFNTSEAGRFIILRVTYELSPGGAPRLAYGDLKKHFAARNDTPSLAETRAAVRAIRRSKAMLLVEGDEDCRSAGSFFKNPIVSHEVYEQVAEKAGQRGLQAPKYPAADGRVKLAAGWLVEQSGFHKGYTRGRVGLSRKHALAIVNRGGATAAEVVALKNEIQQRVRETFQVELKPEPVFVGFGS